MNDIGFHLYSNEYHYNLCYNTRSKSCCFLKPDSSYIGYKDAYIDVLLFITNFKR